MGTVKRVVRPNVPAGYNKRLKQIDRDLSFKWNEKRNRWEIWWKNRYGKKQRVLIVGPGHRYEPLTERVFGILRAGDAHKIGIKSIINMLEEQDRAQQEAWEAKNEQIAHEAAHDEKLMQRLTQKPIGVRTEKEYQKPKGIIIR